jgi:hypothetical protein
LRLVDHCFSVLEFFFDLSLCRHCFIHTISSNIGVQETVPPGEKWLRIVLFDTERLVVNIMATEKVYQLPWYRFSMRILEKKQNLLCNVVAKQKLERVPWKSIATVVVNCIC